MKITIKHVFTAAIIGLLTVTHALAITPAEPKVIGLMFFSDTCGSCKVLDPKIEAVKKDYLGKPILFTTLDHSNDGSKNQAALHAYTLGVGKVYEAQEKASGFMLLVKPGSGEVIAKLTRDMSEADIKASLDKALQN